MRVYKVLGVEQILQFARLRVELQPLLVRGQSDSIGRDARCLQPFAHGVDTFCRGREDIMDLFGRVVLPVTRGGMVGPSTRVSAHILATLESIEPW